MPARLGHHDARTQSSLATGAQGAFLSLRQDVRANDWRAGLAAESPPRAAFSKQVGDLPTPQDAARSPSKDATVWLRRVLRAGNSRTFRSLTCSCAHPNM